MTPHATSADLTTLRVMVPRENAFGMANGSAIVARNASHERNGLIEVHYEGDLYNAMGGYYDQIMHAAGRLVQQYPTVARMTLPVADLVCVGSYEHISGRLIVDREDLLEKWVGSPVPSYGERDFADSRWLLAHIPSWCLAATPVNARLLTSMRSLHIEMMQHPEFVADISQAMPK